MFVHWLVEIKTNSTKVFLGFPPS